MRISIALTSFTLCAGLGLTAREAAAQVATDFASCSPDLAVCDATHDDCCVRTFDPISTDRAIIIPMDRCHQVIAGGGSTLAPPTAVGSWCSNPGPFGANDNGMYETYGLVFRLMQNGIPVHWVINPSKDPPALTANQNLNSQVYTPRDIDTWVLSAGATVPSVVTTALAACTAPACAAPVKLLNPTTLAASAAWTYTKKQFPIRGGAFVIAPEDRGRFNEFWKKTGAYAGFAGNPNYNFSAIDLYELQNGAKFVYQDYRTSLPYTLGNGGNGAPVAVKIDYAPPRLARQAPAGVSQTWLSLAKLNVPAAYPACKTGVFTPADAVFCDVTKTDIGSGALVAGNFTWSWIDNWSANASPCSDPAELAQVNKLREFLTYTPGVRAGGHIIFMEAVINLIEKCSDRQIMGVPGVGLAPDNGTPSEPFILRRPHNVFMQWGDVPTSFAQGAITRWRYFGGGAAGYAPAHLDPATGTLVRLVSEDRSAAGNALCSRHKSSPACDVYGNNANSDYYDVASYLRFEDDPSNGVVFYMAGNQVTNGASHLRMVLNTLISVPLATTPQLITTTSRETSRSSPIVAVRSGVETGFRGSFTLLDPMPVIPTYQGTSNDATFQFPYIKGHFRATNAVTGAVLFDAADHIPPVTSGGCAAWFTSNCRTVFTNLVGGSNIARTYMSTASMPALRPHIGPSLTDAEARTLISRLLTGQRQTNGTWRPALGGIDRSSAAVIEPSPLIRNPRPTMAYVGGLDGMLHAFCVDVQGACVTPGQELWAFIPRVLLGRLRINDGRLDGSPKVSDVYGNFDGTGRNAWRTILTFQVGSGQPGITDFAPAVYALDITNPGDPKILWEVTPPATRGTFELGVGTSLAMAPVRGTTGTRNYTFVVTSNGGTAGAGIRVAAIATETGTVGWTWNHAYPAPRTAANPPVPTSGVPGGPVAIDRDQSGNAEWIAVPSLYGDLWLLDAVTGQSEHGTSPLFRFESDFHPIGASPTLYRDGTGRLQLAVGSGGYVDPVSTSWSPTGAGQYLVSVAVEPLSTPVGLRSAAPDLAFSVDLGSAGQRVYSQAVVAGGELYLTTDRTDVNDTGYGLEDDTGALQRISLASGRLLDEHVIFSGAGSADAAGGRVATTDANGGVYMTDFTSDFDAVGQGAELASISSAGTKLWLRVE